MSLKRQILLESVEADPDPEAFEAWLLEHCLTAPADASMGALRAMAREVLAEWRFAAASADFREWLATGTGNISARSPLLDRLARERYGKNVLALAVRWILDQGSTIALWGARRPDQLSPIEDVLGWKLDDDARATIDRILAETITDPVGPEFMAPPARDEEKS